MGIVRNAASRRIEIPKTRERTHSEERSYVMKSSYVICFIVGIASNTLSLANAQSVAGEVDTLVLRKLRWTMTMAEARESLGVEVKIQATSDTTLTYEDSVFGAKAKISLTFRGRGERLTFANVDIKQPNEQVFEIVSKHLQQRYGTPHDRKKKEEKKIFGTFAFDLLLWKTESSQITVGHGTFGGKTVGVVLGYAYNYQTLSPATAQAVPAEVDTLVLRKLHWAMTKSEAKSLLGSEVSVKSTSDTELEYEDKVFGYQTKVRLEFKTGSGLTSAKATFKGADEKMFEMISRSLLRRLGKADFHERKDEQRPAVMEMYRWKTKTAGIRLIHLSVGRKTMELALFFSKLRHQRNVE